MNSPSLEQRASPAAQQRSSSHSHAGGVLNGSVHQMPLIESGKTSLRAQIQPILRDQQVVWRCRRRWVRAAAEAPKPPSTASSSIAFANVYRTLAVNPLCSRRRNWMEPASRCELPFDVMYSYPAGQAGHGFTAPSWISIRQKFLRSVRSLDAEIGGRHLQRSRQIPLDRECQF